MFSTACSEPSAGRTIRSNVASTEAFWIPLFEQYKFYTGKKSPLGAASRSRLADHLDRIREYEMRAFASKGIDPRAPQLPTASELAHGGAADPGGEGIDMALDDLTGEWRLLADLYALAVEMDRVRFGSITFLAAGERLRMTGQYRYDDRLIYEFDDEKELGKSGSGGCSHEWWHRFNPSKKNEQLRAHAHMKLREVAYFLGRLDETIESNGRSILENSCITISTESGDGRHNDVKRESSPACFMRSVARAVDSKPADSCRSTPRGWTSTTRCWQGWAVRTGSDRRIESIR